ncbi:peptide deformylase [Candidatus Saccharibacteria bacterium]|jgi:peptide deformylase|nr:peptide deformylase [Candidatus Saccharibacteria bacterium]HPR09144.1 peptide deformylase [Candidatus Saccharibacteria bacterium]
MNILRLRRFGDPILRLEACHLTLADIKSSKIQTLITDMHYTNEVKKYGVGLAAPQVGVSVSLAIIMIRPSKLRPKIQPYDQVIINPHYNGIGRRRAVYEGCLSTGTGKDILFGKALRYKKIQATWLDEQGARHSEQLDGLVAHVFQHETDHLQGVLFVDIVRDSQTYMMADEYRKRLQTK